MTLDRFEESLPLAGVPMPRPFQVMVGVRAPRNYTLKPGEKGVGACFHSVVVASKTLGEYPQRLFGFTG